MATWMELASLDSFKAMEPDDQLTMADKFFADQSGLDPGTQEFQDLRVKWRDHVMPTLKMGQAATPTAQDFSGNQVPIDQLSEAAKAGHGMANTLENWGLGLEQMRSLDRSAGQAPAPVLGPGMPSPESVEASKGLAMQIQHAPIDETLAGTVGGMLPSLAVPMGGAAKTGAHGLAKVAEAVKGLSGSAAGGAALGALQPVTGDVSRGTNMLEGAAAFAGGDVAGRAVGGLINRVRAPARGGRRATEIDTARSKAVQEAEDLLFNVPVSARTGGRFAAGLESVFADVPVTSQIQKRWMEYNKANAAQRLANQWGSDAQVLTQDVIHADKKTVGQEFNQYVAANAKIDVDGRFMSAMKNFKRVVEVLPPKMRDPKLETLVSSLYDDIGTKWRRGKVSIDGERYKALREELTDTAKTLYIGGREKASMRVDKVIDALDDMASRSVPEDLQKGYQEARNKWQALKIAQDSVDEFGNVVQSKLNSSINKHIPKAGKGDDIYRRISRSMKLVNEKVPNSGSPARALAMLALASPGLALVPGLTGGDNSPIDYAQALLLPLGAQAAMHNPTAARYLTRQLGAKGPTEDVFSELARRGAGLGGFGALQSGNQ